MKRNRLEQVLDGAKPPKPKPRNLANELRNVLDDAEWRSQNITRQGVIDLVGYILDEIEWV